MFFIKKTNRRSHLMANKVFQITMDENAHRHLKGRARELNLPLGKLIENLMAGLELRIQRAYRVAGVDRAEHRLDKQFIRAIWAAESEGASEEVLHREFIGIGAAVKDFAWTPKVEL